MTEADLRKMVDSMLERRAHSLQSQLTQAVYTLRVLSSREVYSPHESKAA